MTRYAFAELAAAMGETEAQAARSLRVSGSTEQQYRREGMSEKVAERLAIRAGLPVLYVWPHWGADLLEEAGPWVDDRPVCADEKCDERFEPSRSWQRFCSRRCQKRSASRERERRKYQDPEWAARKRAKTAEYRESESARVRRARGRAYYRANAEVMRAKRMERYYAEREAS